MPFAIDTRKALVALVLVLSLLATRPGAERYGDNLQIALPLAGLGCAALTGNAGPYFARFAGMWLTLHATKRGLGDRQINERPGGGHQGFPSGHTAAAAFGAAALAQECVAHAPLLRTAVVVAAGYVGASRIEARRHDIWQVLAGVILALAFHGGFRPKSRSRRLAVLAGDHAWRVLVKGVPILGKST